MARSPFDKMPLFRLASALPSVSAALTIACLFGEVINVETLSLIIDGRIIHDYLIPINGAKTSSEYGKTTPPNNIPFAHQTALADGVLIQPSEGRGLGVFAALPIPSGAWFGEYCGELMTKEQVETRYWEYRDPNEEDQQWAESRRRRNQTMTGEYIFDVRDDIYIDGEDIERSSWCRYLNHASVEDDEKNGWNRCNAESRNIPQTWNGDTLIPPKMFFVASRDIAIGEEIYFDYGEYYWEGYEDMIA